MCKKSVKEVLINSIESLSQKEAQEALDFIEFLRLRKEQWFIDYVNERTKEALLAREQGKKFYSLKELQKEYE